MIVPASVQLLPKYKGASVKCTVLSIDRTTVIPFSKISVREVYPAAFAVVGGVAIPDNGGFICWSLDGVHIIAEESVDPVAPNYTQPMRDDFSGRFGKLEGALGRWFQSMDQSISGNAQEILSTLSQLSELQASLSESREHLSGLVKDASAELSGKVDAHSSDVEYFNALFKQLDESQRDELDLENRLLDIQKTMSSIVVGISEAGAKLDSIEAEMNEKPEFTGEGVGISESAKMDTLKVLDEIAGLLNVGNIG